MRFLVLAGLLFVAGCSGEEGAPADAGQVELDAGPVDAGPVDKSAGCVGTFGALFTNASGRVDGTLTAVVRPVDTHCPLFNDDHVVLQVRFGGAEHRVVVNVQSSFGVPEVRFATLPHALVGPAFSEGWHPGVPLDYPRDLGLHAGQAPFSPLAFQPLIDEVARLMVVGRPIAIHATSSGGDRADSAHKIHRNGFDQDGAIVLEPTSAQPTYLLFHFENQGF